MLKAEVLHFKETPLIWVQPLQIEAWDLRSDPTPALSKVSLTICKSEISTNNQKLKLVLKSDDVFAVRTRSGFRLETDVQKLLYNNQQPRHQRYMISPFLHLARPFDVAAT